MGGSGDARVARLQELKAATEALRGILADVDKQKHAGAVDKARLKQQRWQAVTLICAMKAGLRETFLASDAWKTRVQEQKDVVEAHQLKLQNLLYEKDHLAREIRRCRGFGTKEMDKIEFENGRLPIAVDAESHRQHLDQLTRELETRKRMKTQLKELKAKIDEVEAASQKKQTFLDGLRGELDTIEDSTRGLQKYMHKPVTATLKSQQDASTLLPAPLYTLYCELEAYQTASGCAKQMALSIVGSKGLKASALRVKKREFPSALTSGGRVKNELDAKEPEKKRLKGPSRSPSIAKLEAEKARETNALRAPSRSPSQGHSRPAESGEIVDVVMAENGTDATANNGSRADDKDASEVKRIDDDQDELDDANDADNERDLWRCHEKALLLKLSLAVDDEVSGSTTTEFSLLFQYFVNARVVSVDLLEPSNAPKNVLMNLFPGDDGLSMPRLATAYEFKGVTPEELSFPTNLVASRPYHWAQWICGLFPLKRGDGAADTRRPEPSIRNTMTQLVKRLVVSVQLQQHLQALAKNSLAPVHTAFTGHFPARIKTKLNGWKEIASPNVDLLRRFTSEKSEQLTLSTTGCRYYRVTFRHEHVQVEGIVEISPEYPVRAPRFRLSATDSASTSIENHLKEIEIEVNTFYDELVSKDCTQYLLAHQLRKVQQCVDVLGSPEGQLPRCFGRERRGKDRRPAFVVDATTKEARHR
ncbi:hypothetical protein Poli38472_013153 [Pythium oligandrum]|uniref:THO complex subunit 5 n=1 Tax=Pythium oligandrum TaxID=41045 RepID=A0A8K1FD71_PYTOL|nr:hypothetical protein Poli38472_013153 [Pythium oligandrum]|eukprot:TMW55262.1 hypothetical protein Poli38472_013153 [Pythium oligandrum]